MGVSRDRFYDCFTSVYTMKQTTLFILLGALLWVAGEGRLAVPMRHFSLDLQLPPEERWRDILSQYNSSVPDIISYFEGTVNELPHYEQSFAVLLK